MNKKLLLINSLILCTLFSCGGTTSSTDEKIEVTDMLNRTVMVSRNINKVVCIGAGSLRLYSYVGDMDKLVGVEDIEKTRSGVVSIRPYQMVNEDIFKDLNSCGGGGPSGSAEAEKILTCNPDIIFSLYTSDVAAMDNLQAQTGIPVVTLSYGKTAPWDDTLTSSISLMGRILNKEARAEQVNNYINSIKEDIVNRTKDIKDEDKPSVYLGCNSSWGTHGIESTNANYSIFNVANIKNAASDYIKNNNINASDIDLEALVSMNPDKLVLDAGGLNILKNQYSTNKTIIDSLDAVKNGEVYLQMPFNAYYTNIDLALCNAYYDASVVYPNAFTNVNVIEKVSEILTTLLGKDCYNDIKQEMYGGYQKINSLEEFFK